MTATVAPRMERVSSALQDALAAVETGFEGAAHITISRMERWVDGTGKEHLAIRIELEPTPIVRHLPADDTEGGGL